MGRPVESHVSREDATDPSLRAADRPLDDATPPGFRDDATEPGFRDDKTEPGFREEPTSPTGFRDEPTAPAGTRTEKFQPPWMTTPDPAPREMRPRDPLFVPVTVFVGVLVICIGYVMLSGAKKPPAAVPEFTTSP